MPLSRSMAAKIIRRWVILIVDIPADPSAASVPFSPDRAGKWLTCRMPSVLSKANRARQVRNSRKSTALNLVENLDSAC